MKEFTYFQPFTILGDRVGVLCCDTDYGMACVADIGGFTHYLGVLQYYREMGVLRKDADDCPSVALAILAWQQFKNRFLTDEEYEKVLKDNNIDASTCPMSKDMPR
jgi:hypothetical protein